MKPTRAALLLVLALLALTVVVAACGGEGTTVTQAVTTASQASTSTTATSSSAALSPNTWRRLSPSGDTPSGRSEGAMVFDPRSRMLIIFGGYDGGVALDETWAYSPSANTWTKLSPTGSLPPARCSFSMVWDPVSQRTILFGGAKDPAYSKLLNDTWAYDPTANTWTDLRPTGTPSARWGHAMVYDTHSQQVILVGGQDPSSDLDDMWAYDPKANTWSEVTPKGTERTTWVGHSMVYDPSSGRVIAFGGGGGATERNETWSYDPNANAWTKLSPSGTLPYARASSPMVYDPATKRAFLFGGLFDHGAGRLDDTLAYDPSANAWALLAPAGTLPRARAGQTMACDESSGRVYMFGGGYMEGPLDDIWVYIPDTLTTAQ